MGNKNVITKDDCYLFGKGTHYEIYEKLGAHVTTIMKKAHQEQVFHISYQKE